MRSHARKEIREEQVVMGKIAAVVREMHHKRGTGLWMGCTRLIFQQIKRPPFLLTLKLEGVKETRSLTASEVFPVGAASGAQAKSLSASQDDGGKAGKGL